MQTFMHMLIWFNVAQVSFQKMLTSRTKDLKRGDAKLAWDYMIKMYAGIDTTDKMKLEKRFNE